MYVPTQHELGIVPLTLYLCIYMYMYVYSTCIYRKNRKLCGSFIVRFNGWHTHYWCYVDFICGFFLFMCIFVYKKCRCASFLLCGKPLPARIAWIKSMHNFLYHNMYMYISTNVPHKALPKKGNYMYMHLPEIVFILQIMNCTFIWEVAFRMFFSLLISSTTSPENDSCMYIYTGTCTYRGHSSDITIEIRPFISG